MKFRTGLCLLSVGTTSAFTAPRVLTKGFVAPTQLQSSNSLYAPVQRTSKTNGDISMYREGWGGYGPMIGGYGMGYGGGMMGTSYSDAGYYGGGGMGPYAGGYRRGYGGYGGYGGYDMGGYGYRMGGGYGRPWGGYRNNYAMDGTNSVRDSYNTPYGRTNGYGPGSAYGYEMSDRAMRIGAGSRGSRQTQMETRALGGRMGQPMNVQQGQMAPPGQMQRGMVGNPMGPGMGMNQMQQDQTLGQSKVGALSKMLDQTKEALQNPERDTFPFAPVRFTSDKHAFELFKQIKAAVSDIQVKMLGDNFDERNRIETIIQSVPMEIRNNGPLALRYIIMSADGFSQRSSWPEILTVPDYGEMDGW